jgi:hypothetical protein
VTGEVQGIQYGAGLTWKIKKKYVTSRYIREQSEIGEDTAPELKCSLQIRMEGLPSQKG